MNNQLATGEVVKAFGNLLQVRFKGNIRQGEIAMVEVHGQNLKAEVIEILKDEAKIQVYEDTRGVGLGTKVHFLGDLLEAELGPGLLQSVVDGLQNPLEKLAEKTGLFLTRGVYIPPIDREKKWDFNPAAKVGDVLKRGDILGTTKETHFDHKIMVPFSCFGKVTLTEVAQAGKYKVEDIIAKGKDDTGKLYEFKMLQKWPVKNALIEGKKIKASKMMSCGLRIVDTQFPLAQGGTFCTPGPFGAGKTVLQHHLSKFSKVDIVVVAACGERAGEVVEILKEFPHLNDPNTGGALMERTVIICNTSSMPVAARESSIYLGVTIAEYYRQMGLNVLLLADSTSRWAQALREMSGRLEEIPGEEAFPAYLASRIASFYERAGAVEVAGNKIGSVTIGGAVSPAGGNFEEPVTQATLAVVGAFLGLSRSRSDARRYPAIDPLISWSKYIGIVSKDLGDRFSDWEAKVNQADRILQEGDEVGKRMEVIGEEGTALEDFIVYLKAELYDFSYLQQNAFDAEDAYCPQNRQLIVFKLICEIFETPFDFNTHDEARSYFLRLQNSLKNLNFTAFESEKYHQIMNEIRQHLDEVKKQGASV